MSIKSYMLPNLYEKRFSKKWGKLGSILTLLSVGHKPFSNRIEFFLSLILMTKTSSTKVGLQIR